MKLVHLVGFVIKKFVTMQHGHMNVKKSGLLVYFFLIIAMQVKVKSSFLSFRYS
jgi:hypothetical protein